MKEIDLKIDIHVHTVASGHAFATLNEIVSVAEKKSMDVIGIADHGPSMKGAPVESYFFMRKDVNASSNIVHVLFGCEANILNNKGQLDIGHETVNKLDYVIAGLHHLTPYMSDGILCNTNAIVTCIEKNAILGIAHPISDAFPVEPKPIVEVAKEKNVLLEINSRELMRCSERTYCQYITMIESCSEEGVPMIMGSDSHVLNSVGVFSAPERVVDIIQDSNVSLYNNYVDYFHKMREKN